jgi:CDP-diacylglycerol--glycerol-3-phosphate 3-phosphatidyltransferase
LIEGRGVAFGAKAAGKLKMVLQCLAVSAILATQGIDGPRWLELARDVLIWTAVGLTVFSGVTYLRAAWPHLSDSSRQEG